MADYFPPPPDLGDGPHSARLLYARSLINDGHVAAALAELYSLVTVEPDLLAAWLLIAQHSPHPAQREQALQRILELDPEPVPPEPAPPESASPVEPAPPPDSVHPGAVYASPAQPTPGEARPRPAWRPGRLQPGLVLNGGLTSGFFALVLALLVLAVLAFLLIGDNITQALRGVGALGADETVSIGLVPAIALTGILAFLRANPGAIPIDLSALVNASESAGDAAGLYASTLQSLWQSMGYPAQTGDAILAQVRGIGDQISSAGVGVVAVFFGAWVLLAFFFIFLRARSNRLLHWALGTVGLWLLSGAACGLGTLLFRLVSGQ